MAEKRCLLSLPLIALLLLSQSLPTSSSHDQGVSSAILSRGLMGQPLEQQKQLMANYNNNNHLHDRKLGVYMRKVRARGSGSGSGSGRAGSHSSAVAAQVSSFHVCSFLLYFLFLGFFMI
uniref:Uncharacterized protein n=1 Tax=Vitis vinifera TaxID=29760 RepID=F6HYK4_VITVI